HYLENVQTIIRESLTRLNVRIITLPPPEQQRMTRELTMTLRNAARGSEQGCSAAIQREWDKMKQRNRDLRNHRIKIGFKLVIGVISVAGRIALIAASCGALAAGIFSTVKQAVQIALLIKNELASADTVRNEMSAAIAEIQNALPQRSVTSSFIQENLANL